MLLRERKAVRLPQIIAIGYLTSYFPFQLYAPDPPFYRRIGGAAFSPLPEIPPAVAHFRAISPGIFPTVRRFPVHAAAVLPASLKSAPGRAAALRPGGGKLPRSSPRPLPHGRRAPDQAEPGAARRRCAFPSPATPAGWISPHGRTAAQPIEQEDSS